MSTLQPTGENPCVRRGTAGGGEGNGPRRGSKKSIRQLIYKGFVCSVFALFPYVFPSVGGVNSLYKKTRHMGGFLGDWAGVSPQHEKSPPAVTHRATPSPIRQHQKNGAGFEALRNGASPVACVVDAAAATSTGVRPYEKTLPAMAHPRRRARVVVRPWCRWTSPSRPGQPSRSQNPGGL